MDVLIGKNSFNKVWAAQVGKEEFVKHYSNVKGFEKVNLAKEFDRIVPPTEKKAVKAK